MIVISDIPDIHQADEHKYHWNLLHRVCVFVIN